MQEKRKTKDESALFGVYLGYHTGGGVMYVKVGGFNMPSADWIATCT